ncbi:L,D-transpeptidase family protein [Accumulibacter sp.]|uniref:L,D-transpeptidase family protein n=1 Tax=Accumulibacter sp. TaxID=2053492 RepID=UPI0025EFAF3B|nr:L,D-transpeptidase family protein [Accumulibacter sp.]MCM8610895.1 L,D-transpeptidase family protein [Accumulibacter sp.]MCM8634715.1 L,D-transpeptidase family protein [Accumulibacter sp.]MCM8638269.1 L,D-transpeptidase family protein [Accumulibacter sp.]
MPQLMRGIASSQRRRTSGLRGSAIALGIILICCGGGATAVEGASWFAVAGPMPAAHRAAEILTQASAEGLSPQDYDIEWLRTVLGDSSSALDADATGLANRRLHRAVRRYLNDLHAGRIDPQQFGIRYEPAQRRDLGAGLPLSSPVADDQLAEAVRSAAPVWPQYDALRQALARYRQLVDDPAWQKNLPPIPAGRLNPGQQYAGLALLQRRLLLLGDLKLAGNSVPDRYQGALVDAVKSFQVRHSIAPDGVIGKDSLEQLSVDPAARVRQIGLAMERLRWTPLPLAPRAIVVNVPEFMLHGHEVHAGTSELRLAMKVIVGRAGKTPTPLFAADMRFIEFSPYWNVPPSIARSETLPRLRRDPGYFDRQGFELVGSDGRVVGGLSEAGIDAVQAGQMRIRQRPGASNALGSIKFVFPNRDNIYLHHTPTPQLFKRLRRDFSHGCIRVEEPLQLAKFVLADAPEWTEARIAEAMRRGRSATLRLDEPLPVIIAYSTTVVRDGSVHFLPDIYGLDAPLEEALRQRSRTLRASHTGEIPAESPASR